MEESDTQDTKCLRKKITEDPDAEAIEHCDYCGLGFKGRGLSVHIGLVHPEQEIKRVFCKYGRAPTSPPEIKSEQINEGPDLLTAQERFVELMRELDLTTTRSFLSWVQKNWFSVSGKEVKEDETPELMLDAIAEELRNFLPFDAILPSEKITTPSDKKSEYNPAHTVHVDAFLYDDEQVDALCEEGRLARAFCTKCGSHDTEPITYISHSMSRERLQYIFRSLLPPLDGKMLLDIGSRLGVVLYGACAYSAAARIVGVEMNKDLCSLQERMVQKYKLQDKVEVVCSDVMMREDLVKDANVIIMNNVFEFFLPPEEQLKVWMFLKKATSAGTLIVTVPPLQRSCTGLDMGSWVEELAPHDADTMRAEDMSEIALYKVM